MSAGCVLCVLRWLHNLCQVGPSVLKRPLIFLHRASSYPVSLNVGVLHLFCGILGNIIIVLMLFCVLLFPF